MQITKPRTQRKKLFQAPAHQRHRVFSAPLSTDLKKKHGTNAVPVKMGDTVRVMRGDRKGFEGKITKVDRKKYRVFVEGITREKVDGTAIQIPIHPSKVMIINLNLDDKWRREALKRKGMVLEEAPLAAEVAVEEKKEEIEKKPEKKKAAKKPRKKKKRKEEPSKPMPEKKIKKTRKTKKPRQKRAKKTKTEGAE